MYHWHEKIIFWPVNNKELAQLEDELSHSAASIVTNLPSFHLISYHSSKTKINVAGQVSEPDLRCKMKSVDKVHLSLKAATERRKKAELMGYDLILLGRLAES